MGPYTLSAVDMLDFFERQQEWSYETFGPRTFKGPVGPLRHLEKEATEAREAAELAVATNNPANVLNDAMKEEIADCLFLVFDAAHRAGMSYAELGRVAMEKLKKNKARTWPDWRGTDPAQPIEHDRAKATA